MQDQPQNIGPPESDINAEGGGVADAKKNEFEKQELEVMTFNYEKEQVELVDSDGNH